MIRPPPRSPRPDPPFPSPTLFRSPDGGLSAARLARVIREVPEAFAPKHRWAMDWYYPVLGGVVIGDAGRARLEERRDTFVMEDRGVRCVSDRPWITVAETCECALAHHAVGDRDKAGMHVRLEQQVRQGGGRYWTGNVVPDEDSSPGERGIATGRERGGGVG